MKKTTKPYKKATKIKRPSDMFGNVPKWAKPRPIAEYEKYIIAFSYGKDSLATLLWALKHLEKEKIVVIYNDTGINHDLRGYKEYLENELKITIHHTNLPGPDFFEQCKIQGLPSDAYRWCTPYLKLNPNKEWMKKNRYYWSQEIPYLSLTGCRKEESVRRRSYFPFAFSDELCISEYRPLLEWSEREVYLFIKSHKIKLHPMYKYFTRLSCACCPIASKNEILSVSVLNNKLFEKCCKLENDIGEYWFDKPLTELIKKWDGKLPRNQNIKKFYKEGCFIS